MVANITEIGLGWNVGLGDLKSQLSQIPGITDEEAKKMVNRLEYQWKKANKAAQKALKQQEKDAADSFKSIGEGAKNAAELAGGSFGAMAGSIEKAIKSAGAFSSALGPVGLGTIALGAAVGGVALAVYEMGSAAVEAQERLEKAGLAALIPPEARQSANEYRQSTDALKNALDALIVTYGSEFIPALTEGVQTLTSAIDTAIKYKDTIEGIGKAIAFLAGMGGYDFITESTKNLTGETGRLTKYLQDMGVSTKSGLGALVAMGDSTEEVTAKYQGVNEEVQKFSDTLMNANLPAVAKVDKEYRASLETIQKYKDAGEISPDQAKALQNQAKLNRDVAQAALDKAQADKVAQDQAQQAAKAEAERAKAAAKAAAEQAKAEQEAAKAARELEAARKAVAQANDQLASISQSAYDSTLSGVDAINQKYREQAEEINKLVKAGADYDKAQEAYANLELARRHEVNKYIADSQAKTADDAKTSYDLQIEKLNSLRDAALSIAVTIGNGFADMYGLAASAAADAASQEIEARNSLKDQLAEINEKIKQSDAARMKMNHDGTVNQANLEKDAHLANLEQKRDELTQQLKKQRKEAAEAKKHAIALWKVQKAMQLATVPVSVAAAILQAFAQFGPPPSPAGIAAAASATVAGITQTAAIASAKPPKFHTGLAPDETPAVLQKRESVLTPRATQTLGANTIQSLNDGTFQSGPINISVYIDGKEVAKHIKVTRQAGMSGRNSQKVKG